MATIAGSNAGLGCFGTAIGPTRSSGTKTSSTTMSFGPGASHADGVPHVEDIDLASRYRRNHGCRLACLGINARLLAVHLYAGRHEPGRAERAGGEGVATGEAPPAVHAHGNRGWEEHAGEHGVGPASVVDLRSSGRREPSSALGRGGADL
jgi:hypothetical protein